MMSLMVRFAAFCALLSAVYAYPWQEQFASMKSNVNCKDFPQPLSYHIHVTFSLTSDAQIASAMILRDQAIQYFAPYLGSNVDCQGTKLEPSGRYDNGRLCMISDHSMTNDTIGPFAVGEWSMFAPVHYMNAVVPWFVAKRGEFTLLIHPNTGCEYEDHSIFAQWSGPAWNMNLAIFDQWKQTDEFGETLGTVRNPTCLTNGGVCSFGAMKQYGPQVTCCGGSTCDCNTNDDNCYCK